MSALQNVTGDRADRIVAGQFVHLSPMVLGDDTPDDDWLEVAAVESGADSVTLTMVDESSLTLAANRLVRIGWT